MDTTKNSNGMNPEETSKIGLESAPQAPKGRWNGLLKELLLFIIIAGGVVLPFRQYVAKPYLVDGRSMDPTFATGDYLIVNEISYQLGTPTRNMVVVFGFPDDIKNNPDRNFFAKAFDPGKSFIKRIIGLPGETVVMKDNVITIINSEHPEGFSVDQSYVTHTCNQNGPGCITTFTKTLAGDEYFVMGDNRAESYDSRYWGPLNKKYIYGKPVVRLFGLKKVVIKHIGTFSLPQFSKFDLLPGNDEK